jgi:hypothetical protein
MQDYGSSDPDPKETCTRMDESSRSIVHTEIKKKSHVRCLCSIAVYFEGEKNSLQAGRFFYRAGEYSKVKLPLIVPDPGPDPVPRFSLLC